MLTVYAIRRDNLRLLAKQWGGPASLARKLGHANQSYLTQLIGPHPSREVSEKVAREIEAKLGLAVAWMDVEHAGYEAVDDAALADCVRAVAAALRDAGLRPDPDRYATLVSLVYDRRRLAGRLDEAHVKKLIALVR
jgi:hypothetical protein